ncbi:MAG: cyclic nucleotide-binding domain-containing protein [Bacteroidetes bacterium]|jgi:CRP-like cAMP-binding protein|nr:cyclic nucleotide-binding domain-containing protein [Bacteroidota bacterium]
MDRKQKERLSQARQALKDDLPLNDAQWERFEEGLDIRKYQKGDIIIRAGEVESYLSIVLEGMTRHYVINRRGDDISFEFSFPLEFNSSYSSFLSRNPSRFFIEALEPTVLASMPHSYLMELYRKYPERSMASKSAIENYYIWREEREISLLTETAMERYSNLIKRSPEYLENVPLKHLASYLNIRPESLSRIRKEWRTKQRENGN